MFKLKNLGAQNMKTLKYNKLIRDNIPEIIKASGKECDVSVLNDRFSIRITCVSKKIK